MMITIDSKTIKLFCNEIEGAWWIESPSFRQKYNAYISSALTKGYETGDFGWISRILKSTPDDKIRDKVTKKIMKNLPLSYRDKTQSIIKDNKRWGQHTAQDFSSFISIGINEFIAEKDDKILIEKVKLEPSEFVDFVLDTIILNRNHFSVNDLDKINETLSLIKNRLEAAKEQTAKRA